MEKLPLTLDTLAARVTVLERTAHENSESHGKFYARLEQLENGHGILDTNLKNLKDLCEEIRADVKDLKEKPAKRWDMVASEVVKWFVVAALGAMVIFK